MPDFQSLAQAVNEVLARNVGEGAASATPGTSSNNNSQGYSDYVEEVKQLAGLLFTGTPEEQVAAERRIGEIKEAVGEKDAQSIESLLTKTIESGIEASTGESLQEQQQKLIKDVVKTQLGLGVIKAGAGLAQVLNAAAKEKGITPPDMPNELYKNPALASEINRSMVLANQGDTQAEAAFNDQISQNRAFRSAKAQSSGNVGQYLSNIQAGDRRDERLMRRFAADQSQFKQRERARLASLIARSMQEDQALQRDNWRRFGVENRAYQNNIRQLQVQRNSGFNNLFTGLDQIGQNLPMALNMGGGGNVPGSGLPKDPVNEQVLVQPPLTGPSASPRGAVTGITSQNQVPPPVNNATMLMLGNQAFRNPQTIRQFQDYASGQGYTGFTPGEWDTVTSEAYNNLMDKSF